MTTTPPKRGAFIVFEGVDHSGKTTQAKLLHDYLVTSGIPVVSMRFPDRTTPIGMLINEYLTKGDIKMDDRALHLLFSANRWELNDVIYKHLEEGTTVICDRYADSGVAYSIAKNPDYIYEAQWYMATDRGLIRPDAVIYLDLPVNKAAQRGDYGAEIYEREAFQHQVVSAYEKVLLDPTYWHCLSADQSIDKLHQEVCALYQKIINSLPKLLSQLYVK
jgi:dTMP kinase